VQKIFREIKRQNELKF